jgi:hypothetical protein
MAVGALEDVHTYDLSSLQDPGELTQGRKGEGTRPRGAPAESGASADKPEAKMGWDDSDDDDWEGADLKLPQDSAPPADAWSDEEGHDAHKQPDPIAVPQAAAPAPPKPKTGLALKIEEREKREREEAERKAALRAEMGAVDVSTEGLDAKTAEKVKKKALEEAADLDAAIDAFGVDAPRKPATPAAADGAFESFAAATDADFQKLATMINTKLAQYEVRAVRRAALVPTRSVSVLTHARAKMQVHASHRLVVTCSRRSCVPCRGQKATWPA